MTERTEHLVPVAVVGMMPTLAKVLSSLMLFAFQQLGAGILITTKSYLVRTVILGIFFFLLLPVGKMILVKLGLLSLSPAILSRSSGGGASDPYDNPNLHTLQGLTETLLWEIYSYFEDIFNPDSFDDYLYN